MSCEELAAEIRAHVFTLAGAGESEIAVVKSAVANCYSQFAIHEWSVGCTRRCTRLSHDPKVRGSH